MDLVVQSQVDPWYRGFAALEVAQCSLQVNDVWDVIEILSAPSRGEHSVGKATEDRLAGKLRGILFDV